jgi:hypothetical protein
MFYGASNLTTITGSILSTVDDTGWAEVTTVGDNFFHQAFANNALTSLPTGSFNMSNITSV